MYVLQSNLKSSSILLARRTIQLPNCTHLLLVPAVTIAQLLLQPSLKWALLLAGVLM